MKDLEELENLIHVAVTVVAIQLSGAFVFWIYKQVL